MFLGRVRASADAAPTQFDLPPHHLVTHGVIVGMTGSGKTGLCIGLVEEAIRARVPVLLLDIKGDLPNLALAFEQLDPPSFAPWIDESAAKRQGKRVEDIANEHATKWRDGLASWGFSAEDAAKLRASMAIRLITPGTTAGEPLHVLSPLEVRSDLWEIDEEAAREALSAAISLLLRMVDRDPDPSRGREHVLLSHLAERRLRAGDSSGLEALLGDLSAPPLERIGALSVDEFLSPKERASLATDLNALVASPTFASWRKGAPLDVSAWMNRDDDRVPVTIVSVAHLEDEERMLVLGLVLEQTLAWVRGLSGTTDLRALILFDEVFGFLPPHPANPPTKRPMLALLKQARAFGVGCVLATQNPIDLDYKALSNAGVWMVGRLQTDADRERVVEGLIGSEAAPGDALDGKELASILKALPPRTFFVRDVHAGKQSQLLETRWTLSWLRGPMTRKELKKLVADGRVLAPQSEEKQPEKQAPAAIAAPMPPEGWRVLYPHPPAAPPSAWEYLPHAAIVARAEIADARLGVRTTREVGLMVPFANGTLDLDGAVPFDPDALKFSAVPGARHRPYADGPIAARSLRSIEKALKEQAMAALRVAVMVNETLELVSQPGEPPNVFADRCAEQAKYLAKKARSEIVAKHEPKIARAKTQAAQNEAVKKRDAELMAKESEILRAPVETRTKELAPKKDALVVESFAIVWTAG